MTSGGGSPGGSTTSTTTNETATTNSATHSATVNSVTGAATSVGASANTLTGTSTSGGGIGEMTTSSSSGGNNGTSAGGTNGGTTAQSASNSGTNTATTTGGPVLVDVPLESSVPNQYRQPIAQAGMLTRHSYPCHYYTDDTAGLEVEPEALVLTPKAEPITKQANIYLPYGYDASVEYPVIYVLHGLTDNEDTWLERGEPSPNVLLDNLIASEVIRPVIAVFPNGNSSSQFLTRTFENQAGYYYFANELVNDLMPFVEAQYSVTTDRSARAICGFSMGGMQTINAGLCQSLEHFAWFGAFAAAPTTYTAERIAQYVSAQNSDSALPVHYFYNICGESDGTRDSHEPAVDGLAGYSEFITDDNLAYHNVPGGHDYLVSSVGLYNFLRIAFGN